jgi:hypothetical protein
MNSNGLRAASGLQTPPGGATRAPDSGAQSIHGKVRAPSGHTQVGKQCWIEITAGFRFILRQSVVLGAISFDLFVVLLGGGFAPLPVHARDILDVGTFGLTR